MLINSWSTVDQLCHQSWSTCWSTVDQLCYRSWSPCGSIDDQELINMLIKDKINMLCNCWSTCCLFWGTNNKLINSWSTKVWKSLSWCDIFQQVDQQLINFWTSDKTTCWSTVEQQVTWKQHVDQLLNNKVDQEINMLINSWSTKLIRWSTCWSTFAKNMLFQTSNMLINSWSTSTGWGPFRLRLYWIHFSSPYV